MRSLFSKNNLVMGLCAAALCSSPSAFAQITPENRPQFRKAEILLQSKTISVELAETPDQQAYGLSFVKELKPEQGMLFIFDETQHLSFWMVNTLLPLSIGYFDKDKKLIQVFEMAVLKEGERPKHYQSKRPAKYALEMNKGWFKHHKIKLGSQFQLKISSK